MIQDLLYELEYYIYWNEELIICISLLIALGALFTRFFRRKPLKKRMAATIMSVCFLLAGAVGFVDSYWLGLEELTAQLISIIIPVSVVYAILTADLKMGKSNIQNRNSVSDTLRSYLQQIDITGLKRPVTTHPAQAETIGEQPETEVSPPAGAIAGRRESRSINSAWDHVTFSCTACGETLLGRSRFCYKCGAPVPGGADMIINGKAVNRDEI